MGKKRYFALGLALGMAVTAGAQVYAADPMATVGAYLRNSFSITYNGKVQDKGDYNLLVYKDRSYMPVRYLSEMLGCDVDWDDKTKSITITKKEIELPKPLEPSKPNNSEDKTSHVIDTTDYGKLPQTVETVDYRLTATFLSNEADKDNPVGRSLYLRLTNKSEDKDIRLDQGKTKFDINGEKSDYSMLDSTLFDKKWYTKVAYRKDSTSGESEIEGYLKLPKEVKEKDMVMVTTYIIIDGKTDTIPVTFKLNMSKIK